MINTRLNRSLLVVALAVAGIGMVNADPVGTAPGQNKLQCFETTPGRCTLNSSGAKGSATLNIPVGGGNAGVFTFNSPLAGQLLSEVTTLSFTYTGSLPGAGSPRFIVPLDTDGDTAVDRWAIVAAISCDNGLGLVDAIDNNPCSITTSDNSTGNPVIAVYANWAELVAALPPGAKIATDDPTIVIADEPGIWTVKNVNFGKPGKPDK